MHSSTTIHSVFVTIIQVRVHLAAEAGRLPTEVGSSLRRNGLGLSKSSLFRIVRTKLKLRPYR